MSIDERLDRLTERHEALTQTVEIITGMQRESEKRMDEFREGMKKLDRLAVQLTENMNRLSNIVIWHDERLDAFDGGEPRQ